MSLYDYIKDSEKVLHRHPQSRKRVITEPDFSKQSVNFDYSKYTKNDLVKMLWQRGVDHNKRMLKQDLVDLLEQDDRRLE